MRVVMSVLLLLTLLPSYSGETRLALWPATLVVRADPVELDWLDPARKQLGELTYLGGVKLSSPTRDFGGISAMTVVGDQFTLLSDGGNIVRFRLDSRWRLSGVASAALRDGPGTGWRKLDRDSESMTRDPLSGAIWVGFERANEIWRYDAGLTRSTGHVAPAALANWPTNGGAEAMTRLRNGSFVVIAESGRAGTPGVRQALWFAGDPIAQPDRGFRFRYRAPQGFRPTDVAELPDGRLVVLNRRAALADGFTAAVTVIDRAAVRRGAIVAGREIARFAAPVVHDNFEAIAVTREGRDTILWIASDDNQLIVQRSLLLKFRLETLPQRQTARIP